jgi:hypothetical protein
MTQKDLKSQHEAQKATDDQLEEELEDTFPASDPPSTTQPRSHAGAPKGKKTPEDAAKVQADEAAEKKKKKKKA